MIQEVKQLRVKIDGLSQLVKGLREDGNESGFMFNSPECSKCYDSLILSKAWLGKVLGVLGEETPYKNDGKRKSKKDIEPTADIVNASTPIKGWSEKTYIERAVWLRQEIKKIWGEVMNPNLHTVKFSDDDMGDMYWENFYTHLSEARFWLGFELQRIKE